MVACFHTLGFVVDRDCTVGAQGIQNKRDAQVTVGGSGTEFMVSCLPSRGYTQLYLVLTHGSRFRDHS